MNQQSNCRPFVLHCGRCGAPGHAGWECAEEAYADQAPRRYLEMQRATLDKLKEQQWQVVERDSPIDRVSLPNTAEHEQTPAEETQTVSAAIAPSQWDICKACDLPTLYCKGH
jgi:hypothetical protein